MDINCIKVNNGRSSTPCWQYLNEETNLPFESMNFGRYKPFYLGITSGEVSPNYLSPYNPTNTLFYGAYKQTGNFASNDLFRLDMGRMSSDSYSAILFNI